MQTRNICVSFALFLAIVGTACDSRDSTTFAQSLLAPPDAGSDAGQGASSGSSEQPNSSVNGDVAIGGVVGDTPASEGPGAAPASSVSGSQAADAGPNPGAGGGSVVSAPPATPSCTGCVRIGVYADEVADYALTLDSPADLGSSVISWRVRLYNYGGSVSVIGYVDSGADLSEEVSTGASSFDASAGWITLTLDLNRVPALGSGDAGGFDPNSSFDKSRVGRVGLAVRPDPPITGSDHATLELDAVSFSNAPAFNANFSTAQQGFALIDSGDATASEVPE